MGWGFSIRKERVMSTISFLCFYCYSCWFRGSWAEMAAFAIPRTARKPVMLTRQWNTVYRKQCKCWWILLLLPWVNSLPLVTANASLHVLRLCVGGTSRAGRIPVPVIPPSHCYLLYCGPFFVPSVDHAEESLLLIILWIWMFGDSDLSTHTWQLIASKTSLMYQIQRHNMLIWNQG